MPKKRRKNEENGLFSQNQDSEIPGQKSLGQYCNILMFLSFLGSLLKRCILFETFSQFSLRPTLYKVETRKKILDIRVQHCVWGGGGGGVGPVWLENAPEKQKCPKTFVHDCRQAKMLMTIGQHIKTFSSPKLMIAFQNTGKRSDSQHHG